MSSSHNAFKFQQPDKPSSPKAFKEKQTKANRRLHKKMVTYYLIGNRRFKQKRSFHSQRNLQLLLFENSVAQNICKYSRKIMTRPLSLLVMLNYSRYMIRENFEQKSHYIDTLHSENDVPCQ